MVAMSADAECMRPWAVDVATDVLTWPEMMAGHTVGTTWQQWSDRIAWAERQLVEVQAGGQLADDAELGMMQALAFDAATIRTTGDQPAWWQSITAAARQRPWDHVLMTRLGVPEIGHRPGEPAVGSCLSDLRADGMPAGIRRFLTRYLLVGMNWQQGCIYQVALLLVGHRPHALVKLLELPPQ